MKNILLLPLLFLLGITVFASPVDISTASKAAYNIKKSLSSNPHQKEAIPYYYQGKTVFYIFNYAEGGFVLISADDAAFPVLAYSEQGYFDSEQLPSNTKYWIEKYAQTLARIIEDKANNQQTRNEWKKLLNDENITLTRAVNPLCATTWGQDDPYNLLCPPTTGTHSVTGCVATAMAQIMKKWNYPQTGNGSHSYTHSTYGTLSADFGATTYQWGNMLNSYFGSATLAQKNAVATLMYHCGVSVDMNYSPSGSGAYSWDVPNALITYFRYLPTAELKLYDNFSQTNWIALLKNELDAGRPIYYSGDDGSAGHAFVLDGYDNNNKFHINWGWDGSSNGYYAIGALNPSGYNFNQGNMAVIRIQPYGQNKPIANFTANTTTPAIGEPVTFTDLSANNPTSWYWTFEGGTPATSDQQNPPPVTFSTNGYHVITLTVTNSDGTDTKTKEQYINVGGTPSAWIKQNSGFTTSSRGIDQIFIVSPFIAWAKAYDGTNPTNYIREFTKTKNGGLTWTPGTIDFANAANYGVANIHAFSDTVAFAAMFPKGNNGGVIVKTTNGGQTWAPLPNSPDFSTSWLNFVHFFNANDAVCMGDPANNDFVIYTTNNGGNSWTQVSPAILPNAQTNETGVVNYFSAVGNTIWFSTTKGRIYKSTDKGLTWTVASTGLNNYCEVHFRNANVGFAVMTASPYTLKKTVDGGSTWTTVTPTGAFVKMPHLAYVPGTTSMWVNVAAGPSLGSSYSLDDCASFINIDTGSTQYTCVKFYDENTGWAGSFNQSATDGGIYKWDNSIITQIDKPKTVVSTDEILVYPNPAKDFINIAIPQNISSASIFISNLIGQTLRTFSLNNISGQILPLDFKGFNSGIYFITISTPTDIKTYRIIIEQ